MKENYFIAIDPGQSESAYVIIHNNLIEQFGKVKNEEIYTVFVSSLADKLFIEMISSYGMPVGKEVFDTCVWIGRFYEYFTLPNIFGKPEAKLIYRKDIKLHHCGTARAKDSNIIQALKDKYGDKGTKNNPGYFYGFSKDVWQAFALAAYVIEKELV